MECAECGMLRQALDRVALRYMSARGEFYGLRVSASRAEFDRAKAQLDDARIDYQAVWARLEQHEEAHAGQGQN